MERDLQLVKAIALSVREKPDLTPQAINLPGFDADLVSRHVELMIHTGLLDGKVGGKTAAGPTPSVVRDLTSYGHDFVGAATSHSVWSQLRELFPDEKLQQVPLRVVAGVAIRLMEIIVEQATGIGDPTHETRDRR
ncbi:DUF2513 domain-containing protein [Phenylobacterium immobile]|uniref:DUF2513 domain-containing protein n=1 Tax=Phenylobacterium immobile TaxID=21 RepID=UPI000AFDD8E0|nr:DUF2513 domain-containing protein [Phenylobacterium immobile]